MELNKSKLRFDSAGYYFIGLAGLVILGFWPSYFVKFFNGTADFTFYFHFHAVVLSLWIFALIIQPILIRKKKLKWHRIIGKISYVLFPLVFISIALLTHSRHPIDQKNLEVSIFMPFKDLLIFSTAYFIAIRYRHNVDIHARAMIVTGIVCIDPALARFLARQIPEGNAAGFIMMGFLYSLLIFLIIRERNQKSGRWVFPLTLGMYMVAHIILIFHIHMRPFEIFSKWFASLPLT